MFFVSYFNKRFMGYELFINSINCYQCVINTYIIHLSLLIYCIVKNTLFFDGYTLPFYVFKILQPWLYNVFPSVHNKGILILKSEKNVILNVLSTVAHTSH